MTIARILLILTLLWPGNLVRANEAAERGRQKLTGVAYIPPAWPGGTYESAVKKFAGGDAEAGLARYGLHPAPYKNDGLPMGLKRVPLVVTSGLSFDCMVCHGGSIAGQSYIGLGNASGDFQVLMEDLTHAATGRRPTTPFRFTNVRGTSEAGGMAVYLLGFRNPDLSLHGGRRIDLGLHDDLCEDVPAWWLLKKKRTMYYTGGADARSVRSLMQFMMSPLNGAGAFSRSEADFRDIQAYLLSLEAPKYPLSIDHTLARTGQAIFTKHCASCHGTYGEKWTYPNRIIPLEEIGTDPRRHDGIKEAYGHYYAKSWFAKERPGWLLDDYPPRPARGYQAPPLDGIWATAPYFHNGSVPTLWGVLKSDSRPRKFTRSYRTDLSEYDERRVGWRVTELSLESPLPSDPVERRKIYDTRESGRGNMGHTYGDDLSDAERWAVIEYLKTL